ncbi:hypothetical protein BH11ACT6_BH11ACT6_55990 [soil metagenome]
MARMPGHARTTHTAVAAVIVAKLLFDGLFSAIAEMVHVQPTGKGVPGPPTASCFYRTLGALPGRQLAVHLRGRADRYAFTVHPDSEIDAKQPAAAQYRILTGE